MAAYLEWRCHITLTTRSSPRSIISVRNKARGRSSPHLVTPLWNWSVVVEIGFWCCMIQTAARHWGHFLSRMIDSMTPDNRTQQYGFMVTKEPRQNEVNFLSRLRAWQHVCIRVPEAVFTCAGCIRVYVRCCQETGVCQEACVFRAAKSVKERSCQHGWYVQQATRHKQRRPPMSNVTALISFQCSPGITAGARGRHTSLLHRMRFPGDSAIHKSAGFILMESSASCRYCFVLRCMLILGFIFFFPGNILHVIQRFSSPNGKRGIVFPLISCTAAPFKLV